MQSVSCRIWTRVAVSISYDDNHYTTGTSFLVILSSPSTQAIKKHERNKKITKHEIRQIYVAEK